MTDTAAVRTLVARQLALIENAERREALETFLVEPREEMRSWDYGAPGTRYPCWVVAEAPERQIELVYCEHGFGPEMPWGFLSRPSGESDSLGMDSQWDWYLEGAFVFSGLWDGPVSEEDEPFGLSPEERGLR